MTLARMITSTFVLFAATAALAVEPIAVTASAPARIADGDPLAVTVVVENRGSSALSITSLQPPRNLRASIRAIETSASRCTAQEHHSYVPPNPESITLRAGESASRALDAFTDFPLGLRPGTYELVVEYSSSAAGWSGRAASAPVRFEVVAPTGARAAAHADFLRTCEAAILGAPDAAERALALSERKDIPYTAALLDRARATARGEARIALNQAIERRYPSSSFAERARLDTERMTRRSDNLQKYSAYLAAMAVELERNESAAATAAKQFRPITAPGGFNAYEQFLSKHGKTFFAGEALHRMIVAVERGVLPPGASARERDRTLAQLYERLLRTDRRNYWVSRAMADLAVQELIARFR